MTKKDLLKSLSRMTERMKSGLPPTEGGKLIDRIPQKQQIALKALLEGETVAHAARLAGVHRATVHRWISRSHTFQQYYLAGLEDRMEQIEPEIDSIIPAAFAAVREILQHGDTTEKLVVLRVVGFDRIFHSSMAMPKRGDAIREDETDETLDIQGVYVKEELPS
jgi:hypothetical protein